MGVPKKILNLSKAWGRSTGRTEPLRSILSPHPAPLLCPTWSIVLKSFRVNSFLQGEFIFTPTKAATWAPLNPVPSNAPASCHPR